MKYDDTTTDGEQWELVESPIAPLTGILKDQVSKQSLMQNAFTLLSGMNVECYKFLYQKHQKELLAPFKGSLIGYDKTGFTPLHYVVGQPEIMLEIIKLHPSSVNLSSQDGRYTTPIFFAVATGRLDSIQTLSAYKASLTAQDINGNTLLHEVAHSHYDLVERNRNLCTVAQFLLEKGLKPNQANKLGKSAIDIARTRGETCSQLMKVLAGSDDAAIER